MTIENDNHDVLDFTSEGQNPLPYQCEFCSVLLMPHSDPERLTSGQLWICPYCGNVKDESLVSESIKGARPSGTLMDDAKPSDQANSIQFIDEEKGLPRPEYNRRDQLIKEEFYDNPEFRRKGIVKDSINISEVTK